MASDSTITSTALPTDYVIGGYRIIRKIGQGGFGISYLAEDIRSGEKVVIKENFPRNYVGREQNGFRVLPDGKENQDWFEWTRRCFLNEARILNLLDHPNIVKVIDMFEANNTVYLVICHLEGCSLTELYPLDSPGITELDLLALLRPLLRALQYLQNKGITHRDIKPDNILMSSGEPILIDFGTARNIYSSKTATQVGTNGFAPLEQISENSYERKPKPRLDLYALGATCYYLMTGKYPQQPAARLLEDEMIRYLRSSNIKARYSAETLSGVMKALELKPGKRWQSAQDWLDSLPTKPIRRAKKNHVLPIACGLLIFGTIGTLSYRCCSTSAEKTPVAKRTDKAQNKQQAQPDYIPLVEDSDIPSTAEIHPMPQQNTKDAPPMNYNEALLEAAKNDDIDMLSMALAYGADINAKDAEGRTALDLAQDEEILQLLQYRIEENKKLQLKNKLKNQKIFPKEYNSKLAEAAKENNTELIELLLAAGANVNSKDNNGNTPLTQAAKNGSKESMKLLLTAGANANLVDNKGYSPLAQAAENGHIECVKLLLAAGVNVNSRNNDGNTPLALALKKKQNKCARILLNEVGIEINTLNKDGKSPYDIAQDEEIKLLLLQNGADRQQIALKKLKNMGVTSNNYNSKLLEAVQNDSEEQLNELITLGIVANIVNKKGETPLIWAAKNGHGKCVKYMLNSPEIDVNKTSNQGETALFRAIENGHTECINLLLAKQGIDIDKANLKGETPLFKAADKGHTESVELLIKARADVDKENSEGETPLYRAVDNGHYACARLLIAARAKVNKANRKNVTPLSRAAFKNRIEYIEMLLAAGADVSLADSKGYTPLYQATNRNNAECIKLLLEAGANVNTADLNGYTPLCQAAKSGYAECTKLLLEAGANVNTASLKGLTPLIGAARYGHVECVKLLIARPEIDINKEDHFGSTPLLWAASKNHISCVQLLISAGADVHKNNMYGATPINSTENYTIIQLLRAAGAE